MNRKIICEIALILVDVANKNNTFGPNKYS